MNFVKKIGYKAVFLLLLGLADSLAGQSVTGPVITLNPSADALCLSNPFISFLIGFEDNGSFGTQTPTSMSFQRMVRNGHNFIPPIVHHGLTHNVLKTCRKAGIVFLRRI